MGNIANNNNDSNKKDNTNMNNSNNTDNAAANNANNNNISNSNYNNSNINNTSNNTNNNNSFICDISSDLCVKGTVTTGYGKGAYFIGQEFYFNEFTNALGFSPFKGTLNLIIEDSDIDKVAKIKKNFTKLIKGRDNWGDVNYIKISIAKLSNNNDNDNDNDIDNNTDTGKVIEGAIVFPAKTQHPNDYLEIIAKEGLRNELSLEDDDIVIVSVLK
ncbi:MAG: DUF120 domain-containing protein [Methanobacteriaceae archaeon]